MTQTYYKIVDVIGGQIKTLYHGNNGSKTLQPKKWLKSQQRIAKKYGYITGWNIIPTHEECIEYLKLFKKLENKQIVKCQAKDVWEKPTKNKVTVLLAKEIFIEEFV
jgi:hypothetical protein